MKWFINLKTGTKLLLAFGLVVFFLAVVIVTAGSAISAIQQDYRAAVAIANFEVNNNGQRAAVLTLITITNRADQEATFEELKSIAKQNDDLMRTLPGYFNDSAETLRQLGELTTIRDELKRTRDEQVVPMIREGRMEEARALSLGVNQDRYVKMRDLAERLAGDAQERAKRMATRALITFLLVGFVAVLIAGGAVIFLSRIIAVPLKSISATAERIAVGDLGGDVSFAERTDEVGVLAQTFARMTASLKEMAGVAGKIASGDLRVQARPLSDKDLLGNAFAAMVENLRRLTSDLTEGVNVLGSAASEISTSTAQFATSASETATAVSETTTTVEEVRQTAQVSSQKARSVSETAQKVAQISQGGKRATEETVEGMTRIRQQMDAIAESMVRLSEQSQAIGQIVTTVEDLAAQSNLLAVNAAIEAARAGEQGKGFAVVAQEVKSLAEQSKQATGQVRAILNDIQKATTAAVMATEQGSKAVEAGVKQSSQAGQSIQTLAGGVGEAAQAAAQIAASSQQQLVGVDQVASAMESIKQASTQNVESAKQLETAARNIEGLGHRLKQMIERYKV